jgi:hypothetical protein
MGDSIGAGIIDHLSKGELQEHESGEECENLTFTTANKGPDV